MTSEVLTVDEMYVADRFAAAHGVPSIELMEHAGRAVADEICRRWTPRPCAILCGPGNNGGDGYVAARHLQVRGWDVWVEALADIGSLKGDAAEMARRWTGKTIAIATSTRLAQLFIDALFGAGLSRPLEGAARSFALASKSFSDRVVAIDVPSGVHGDTAKAFDS